MKLKKSFHLALNILLHSKLRSWLTIIGIVIGIAAVVLIVSISQGAQQEVENRFGDLGADLLTVTPGFKQARGFMGRFAKPDSSTAEQKNLTSKDVMVLKTVSNVKHVMGTVSNSASLTYLSKTVTLNVNGVYDYVLEDITTEEIAEGRFLTPGDSYSVVLGGNIVENTFEDGIPLNRQVIIEGSSFKVVGITESGSTIYMPIEIARLTLDDIGSKRFNSISVKIENVDISEETVDDMTKKLMMSRGILTEKDRDFTIINPTEWQETITESMNTLTLFLTAIAAVSLLVGGIGIANTMFTSVLEKTKDIGIMKAIGTKNRDILLIFLMNSGLIGLIGGIGGVVLGFFGSSLVSSMGSGSEGKMGFMMMSNTLITNELIIGSLLFSTIIGMIAGVIPAYRASKLKPVDALRYE